METGQSSVIQDVAYEGAEVEVDGRTFIGCSFTNSALLYGGGVLPTFQGCRFEGVRLQFAGEAANTIEYLAGMSKGGFVRSVGKITDGIRAQMM